MRPIEAVELESARLVLRPLAVEDAEEMVIVLSDPALYRYTGGAPPGVEELTQRYDKQIAGPAGSDETWLNWIVRRQDDKRAVGFVQATLRASHADVAWVIGAPDQGQGFATESATRMCDWLRSQGVGTFTALIHPEHAASQRVAVVLGLAESDQRIDGETVWR